MRSSNIFDSTNLQETMLFCYLGKIIKNKKNCSADSSPLLLLFILRSNDGSFCILANVSLAINYLLSRLYFVPLLHIRPYATVVSFPQLMGGGGLS